MIGVDDTLDDATDQTAPVWAVFGDLMAGLLGAFVLILVGVLVVQNRARKTYSIPHWADGYFDVDAQGRIVYRTVGAVASVEPCRWPASPPALPVGESWPDCAPPRGTPTRSTAST